jgi:hypothetical protein
MPERFVVRPGGLLVWMLFWLSVPLVVFVWYLVRKALSDGLDGWDALAIVMACLACSTLLGFSCMVHRAELAPGDFFVLDKVNRVLTLSRQGCEYQQSQILCFVEVQGWHTVVSPEGKDSSWLGEVTVLARTAQGIIVRQAVVTSLDVRGVHRCARDLAEFFRVKLRQLKLDRKTRRRLAQAANEQRLTQRDT